MVTGPTLSGAVYRLTTAAAVGSDRDGRRLAWLLVAAGGIAYAVGRRHGRRALRRELTDFDLDEIDEQELGELGLGSERFDFDDSEFEAGALDDELADFDPDFDDFDDLGTGFGDDTEETADEAPTGTDEQSTDDGVPEEEGEPGTTGGGVVAGAVLLAGLAAAARRALRRGE